MSGFLGGGISEWLSLLSFLVVFMAIVVVCVMLLALLLSEDEQHFWSEWHPFVDKKRRRIVLECTPTGWIVLKELPGETKNELRRIFYAPCTPFAFLGWKKTVAVPTTSSVSFQGDKELWEEHFGEKNNTSILV